MLMFLLMLVGHALADYPLQGDFLARAKNHRAPIPGVPSWQALVWHAVIHGGAVGLITGSPLLGSFEYLSHIVIDFLKCDGKTSFNVDQLLHVVCKAVWAVLATQVLA